MKKHLLFTGKYARPLLLAAALLLNGVAAQAVEYTSVEASPVKVSGMKDSALNITLTGRYNSGAMNSDGGSAEIVAYDTKGHCMYVVNGIKGTLDRVPLGALSGRSKSVIPLSGSEIDVAKPLTADDFAYGDMTSVAVHNGLVAVSVQAEGYADPGRVAIFETNGDTLRHAVTLTTGVQPDMVTFTPDGSKLLIANEGEPRMGTEGVNPAGSVTIATLNGKDLSKSSAVTVGFDKFDEQRAQLTKSGVIVRKDAKPSNDFEPEYVTPSRDGRTAYVALQEANAIAVLDVDKADFTAVYPLGVKDFGVQANALDLIANEKIAIEPQAGVFGIYMPDGIALHEANGKTYLLTANEGDSRADWSGLDEEVEAVTSPTGNVTMPEEVVWYDASLHEGLDQDRAYIFGGRSFGVWEVTPSGLVSVFDSGSAFEEITAAALPEWFNCSNDDISLEDRSAKKGVEPEYVTTGTVGDRTYAFVGLERIGGVMVYDITDAKKITFVNYINSRAFDSDVQGDVGPEGLYFIPAAQSVTGNALLLAACEVSGTVAVFEVQ